MKKIIILSIGLILAACTFQTKHRGYVFPDDLESRVAKIKTTAQLQNENWRPIGTHGLRGRDMDLLWYG